MAKSLNVVGATTYQRIKRDIIFGRLAPGSKLKLDGLKERYEASMSTLRETLNRLASEGFVAAQDQRGFFVTDVSRDDLIEIANLRVLLECHALRLSITNGDTDWEGNLVAAHHKLHLMEQKMMAGDEKQKEDWKRYDWEFHQALISACGSKNLLSLHAVLFDKYLRYQMLVLTYRGDEAVQEHREMFEAALARDEAAAAAALKTHVEKGLEHTLEAF
ncbi:transcriptional regulator, GntR family [Cognatiyoonia sediminum]|uniref:Transcriptional regulator, GntR family n=1 Tax=Cognatiyoonia sediminum TaxID=1508389 RepID=A0A1M5TBN3_9RHOB|nr:GntR family transcriptional regulator [Cognatiyoonia sediminum]SHH47753.1 transcriptional regulator, GntR family [Cognatiyoonia sediminum]